MTCNSISRMNKETEIRLLDQLKRHEQGNRVALKPYKCPAGKMTIGWGHNYQDKPLLPDIADHLKRDGEITPIMADRQLLKDVEDAEWQAFRLCTVYEDLDEVRKATIVNMIFNLGEGFLSEGSKHYWPKFNEKLRKKDFLGASFQMGKSKWHEQVGDRADELIYQMRTGKWRG